MAAGVACVMVFIGVKVQSMYSTQDESEAHENESDMSGAENEDVLGDEEEEDEEEEATARRPDAGLCL